MDFQVFRTSFSRVGFLSLFVALIAIGCSQGSDIQLEGAKPSPPLSPVNPVDQTGNPSAPKDPPNSTAPNLPPPTQSPIGIAPRYRMFCDDRYPPFLNTVSSLASSRSFGVDLVTGELDVRGQFDPTKDRNLEVHLFPQIVSLPSFGTARVLFTARRMGRSVSENAFARHVFIADVDITNLGGAATFVAAEVPVTPAVQNAAAGETLSVRSIGVSDEGRYLLIGTKDGYELRDSTTLKSMGLLQVGSASDNFNPSLRESDMIFSVSNLQTSAAGASFETRLFSLGLTVDGKLKSSKLIATASSLRRPLVPVSRAAGDSFAAIGSSNKIILLSPLKLARGSSTLKIASLPAKGRLSSAAAFWRDTTKGDAHAATVFEDIVPSRGRTGVRYKVELAFVRVLQLDEVGLSAATSDPDFEYPVEARQMIEAGTGAGPVPGVSEMKATPDGKAVFGLFPGGSSKQIYRLNAFSLDRVSQAACSNLSIGVEL